MEQPTRKFKDIKFFKFIQLQGQHLPFSGCIFIFICFIFCLDFTNRVN